MAVQRIYGNRRHCSVTRIRIQARKRKKVVVTATTSTSTRGRVTCSSSPSPPASSSTFPPGDADAKSPGAVFATSPDVTRPNSMRGKSATRDGNDTRTTSHEGRSRNTVDDDDSSEKDVGDHASPGLSFSSFSFDKLFDSIEEELSILVATIEWAVQPHGYMLVDEYSARSRYVSRKKRWWYRRWHIQQVQELQKRLTKSSQRERVRKLHDKMRSLRADVDGAVREREKELQKEMKLLRWSNKMVEHGLQVKVAQVQNDMEVEVRKKQFFKEEIDRLRERQRNSDAEVDELQAIVQSLKYKAEQLHLENGQRDLEMKELKRIVAESEAIHDKIVALLRTRNLVNSHGTPSPAAEDIRSLQQKSLGDDECDDEYPTLHDAVDALEEDLRRMESAKEELGTAQIRVHKLIFENNTMQAKMRGLETEVSTLSAARRKAEEEMARAAREAKSTFEMKNAELQCARDTLETAKEEMHERVQEVESARKKGTKHLRVKIRELGQAKRVLSARTRDLKAASEDLIASRSELRLRTTDLKRASDERNKLRDSLENMEFRTRELVLERQEINDTRNNMELLGITNENLAPHAQVAKLEEEKAQVQYSADVKTVQDANCSATAPSPLDAPSKASNKDEKSDAVDANAELEERNQAIFALEESVLRLKDEKRELSQALASERSLRAAADAEAERERIQEPPQSTEGEGDELPDTQRTSALEEEEEQVIQKNTFIDELRARVPRFAAVTDILAEIEALAVADERASDLRVEVEAKQTSVLASSEALSEARARYEALRVELVQTKSELADRMQEQQLRERELQANGSLGEDAEHAVGNLCASIGMSTDTEKGLVKNIENVRAELEVILRERHELEQKVEELSNLVREKEQDEVDMMKAHETAMQDLMFISGFIKSDAQEGTTA